MQTSHEIPNRSQQVNDLVLSKAKRFLHAFHSRSNEIANDCVNKLIILFKAISSLPSWEHHHSKQALPFGGKHKAFSFFGIAREWFFLCFLFMAHFPPFSPVF
jgi:hypothetical protein